MRYRPITRRHLIQTTGLVLASGSSLSLQSCSSNTSQTPLNLYLAVDEQTLTFILPRSEMGQDIITSFAMLIAEELDAPIELVRVRLSKASLEIPDQMTVGSSSIRNWWQQLRQIGADTKKLLIQQAATRLSAPINTLYGKDGYVLSRNTHQKVHYLDLLVGIQIPGAVESADLKRADAFTLVGTNPSSLYAAEKVTGTYNFVHDISASSECLYVVSIVYHEYCPPPSKQDLDVVKNEYNLTAAILVNDSFSGYACRIFLCHNKTWTILKAKTWLEAQKRKHVNSGSMIAQSKFEQQCKNSTPNSAISNQEIHLSFITPALPHAPMETPAARIKYTPHKVEVWAPTQAPDKAREAIAKRLNMAQKQVELQTIPMGGGFGRKRYTDYLSELAVAAKTLYTDKIYQPLTLLWSREDELSREHYRPATLQEIHWKSGHPNKLSLAVTEGRRGAHKESISIDCGLPLGLEVVATKNQEEHHFSSGIWRSVHHGYHAFALCSAVDEICYQNQNDPIEFYLSNPTQSNLKTRVKQALKGNESTSNRQLKVIEAVQSLANWKSREVSGLGFAAYSVFGSHIALIVQVSIQPDHSLKIMHVWSAVDCGLAIHPDNVKAQIEGGILFGLSACLFGTVPPNKDALDLNFDILPVLRMKDSPKIDVTVINNREHPTGVGELAVPPIAPAICNAIRDLTQYRFVQLPLLKENKLNFDNALHVNTHRGS